MKTEESRLDMKKNEEELMQACKQYYKFNFGTDEFFKNASPKYEKPIEKDDPNILRDPVAERA
jgi:hypothetical protein